MTECIIVCINILMCSCETVVVGSIPECGVNYVQSTLLLLLQLLIILLVDLQLQLLLLILLLLLLILHLLPLLLPILLLLLLPTTTALWDFQSLKISQLYAVTNNNMIFFL